jgi:hypothetical protein
MDFFRFRGGRWGAHDWSGGQQYAIKEEFGTALTSFAR